MSEKQRIGFLCHPYHRGGVTRWMADAAMGYAKNGLEVYFITVEPAKDFFSAMGRETLIRLITNEKNSVQIVSEKVAHEFEFGTSEYRSFVYQRLLAGVPIGTPIILSDDAAVWEAATLLYQSYPIIGVLHADEEQYYNLAEKYCNEVAALVCVSNRINKTVQEKIPAFDRRSIYTIPCGINLPAINFNIVGNDILQLIYVGRISEYQKRTGDLEKICSQLAKTGVHFHLLIIGDGESRSSLEDNFSEDGLLEYVTFYGWRSQDEVGKRLSESDILILTSAFEGMPIAMMEALGAGCGVVGTRVSGIEDYELHSIAPDCISLFEVGDIGSAVDKIKKIAAIPAMVRNQAGRKLAESEFSMSVCLEKYLRVIAATKSMSIAPSVKGLSRLKRIYSNLLSVARSVKVRIK